MVMESEICAVFVVDLHDVEQKRGGKKMNRTSLRRVDEGKS